MGRCIREVVRDILMVELPLDVVMAVDPHYLIEAAHDGGTVTFFKYVKLRFPHLRVVHVQILEESRRNERYDTVDIDTTDLRLQLRHVLVLPVPAIRDKVLIRRHVLIRRIRPRAVWIAENVGVCLVKERDARLHVLTRSAVGATRPADILKIEHRLEVREAFAAHGGEHPCGGCFRVYRSGIRIELMRPMEPEEYLCPKRKLVHDICGNVGKHLTIKEVARLNHKSIHLASMADLVVREL